MSRTALTAHLSDDMKAFFRRVVRGYELAAHHKRLLIGACEAHDRATQARLRLALDGLVIVTRHGETKAHPAVAVERDSMVRFARLLRELGLSDQQTADAPRPPRPSGRYQGRP